MTGESTVKSNNQPATTVKIAGNSNSAAQCSEG